MTLVLALNAGSTSLKFGVYRVAGEVCETVESAQADGFDVAAIESKLSSWPEPDIVSHRIVHGGAKVRRHCLIDDAVFADLEAAKTLAPLHVPPALAGVRWARARFPGLPQVACLDTAFHAAMPDVARTYPLPKDIRAVGVQRYGFHGLSCASIVRQVGRDIPERLVIAHLGGGCSVTAVRRGGSIDTTMGLTPTGGLMMSTRSGDLDPGVLIYLMRRRGLDVDALEALVDRDSGLLGASDRSGDLRVLRQSSDAEARLAVEMFVASVAKGVASMMTSLGGADLLVFTGGIGENDRATRDEIVGSLSWAGVGGSCVVRALPSKEDEELSHIAAALT
jgi:acetate kinase